MSLEDFKRIFYMEWAHRILGRLIGVVFVGPLIYFTATKKISPRLASKLGGLALLLGGQGFLGWYMVQSGLDDAIMDTPGAVPRVSQYRLAAHLGLALVLYAGMFATGLSVLREFKYAHGTPWRGIMSGLHIDLERNLRRFTLGARISTGLVLLTALSGNKSRGIDQTGLTELWFKVHSSLAWMLVWYTTSFR
jgi:heme a synthase